MNLDLWKQIQKKEKTQTTQSNDLYFEELKKHGASDEEIAKERNLLAGIKDEDEGYDTVKVVE